MEIKNIKHNQQINAKLARHLRHKMTPQEAQSYADMYAEYNQIHAGLTQVTSTVQGVWGNKYKKQTVKEIL